MKIAVIGSGSWGVALSVHLARCGHEVKIWSFDEEEKRIINEERKCKFLPGLTINENIICSNNFEEVIEGASFILHVTPSKFTRETFKQYKQYVGNKPVIICSKGFEKESLKTLDEVILEELPTAKIRSVIRSEPCRRSINCSSYSTSNCIKTRRHFKNDTKYIYV